MVRLDFYATGLDDRKTKIIQAFPPQLASPDRSSNLEKRNLQEQYFKADSKQKHEPSVYRDNYTSNNETYSENKKFFQSHYDKIKMRSHSDHQTKDEFYKSPRHFANLKLQRERVYAESPRLQNTTSYNFSSNFRSLSRLKPETDQFPQLTDTVSSTKSALNQIQSQKLIERDHFYVTRPLLRINKDFVEKPLVKNVQVVSEDLPNWCQTTNRYYQPENIDKTKKQKIVVKVDQDIFGNEIRKYPNNFMFFCEPPSKGQRFEKSRMVIADKLEDGSSKKTQTKKELMFGKCRLKWDEDVSKQKFEPRLPLKIGHEGQPFIKKLNMKRNQSVNEFRKIGELDSFKLQPKDKPVQVKIGHGSPEIINPLKFRLD